MFFNVRFNGHLQDGDCMVEETKMNGLSKRGTGLRDLKTRLDARRAELAPKEHARSISNIADYRARIAGATWLYGVRARHELTQQALAKIAGIKRQTILEIEKRQKAANLRTLFKIAEAVGEPLELSSVSAPPSKVLTTAEIDRMLGAEGGDAPPADHDDHAIAAEVAPDFGAEGSNVFDFDADSADDRLYGGAGDDTSLFEGKGDDFFEGGSESDMVMVGGHVWPAASDKEGFCAPEQAEAELDDTERAMLLEAETAAQAQTGEEPSETS